MLTYKCQCSACRSFENQLPSLAELQAKEKEITEVVSNGQKALNQLKKQIDCVKFELIKNKLCRVWRDVYDYNKVKDGVTIRLITHYDETKSRFIDAHGTPWKNAEPVTLAEIEQYLLK